MCKNKLTKYSGNCNWMDKLFHIHNSTSLLADIKSYWKFNNNLIDATGNGNDGTGVNNPTYIPGIIDTAVNFVAASLQYITVPSSVAIPTDQSFTITLWVRFAEDVENQNIIVLRGSEGGWSLQALDQGNVKQLLFNSSLATPDESYYPLDEWLFVAFGYDNDRKVIFISVNNTDELTEDSDGLLESLDAILYFGADSYLSNSFLNGTIDECGLWWRVLTSDEIATLYNGGAGITYPFTS